MKKFKAFSLLEVAIVLAIVGIMSLSVFKGYQMMNKAKLQKTANQIESLQVSIDIFKATYGNVPGNYKGNSIPNIVSGDGTGILKPEESDQFWVHLINADLIPSKFTPSIGGIFIAKNLNGQNYIILTLNSDLAPALTYSEALSLKAQIVGGDENDATVELNGTNCNSSAQKNQKVCNIQIKI